MMKISRLEKGKKIGGNIIKDVRNLFRLKKEIDVTAIKDIRDIFRFKKETEAIKDRIIRDNEKLFKHEGEDYYKPVRVGNFGVTIILNIKVTVIEINHCQLKNNYLIKLDNT